MNRWERRSALTGIAAVTLWIGGLVLLESVAGTPSHATDQQLLTNVRVHTDAILAGGWLFMLGGLLFLWFAGILRGRLAAAEQGVGTFSAIAFAGGIAASIFGIAIPAGRVAAAINKDDISASTAGTLRSLNDVFFVATELSAIVLLVAAALVAWRTRVLPRWWALAAVVVAVLLVIGPIGWAALILGLPAWTVVTSLLLVRSPPEGHEAKTPVRTTQPAHG